MKSYQFLTLWRLEAPIDEVWNILYDVENWPRWWRFVKAVQLQQPGDSSGIGAIRRYRWSSRLPYTLEFDMRTTLVEPPYRIVGEATGELEGTGAWQLSWSAPHTDVLYDWRVRTTKKWMNLLAPIAAPVFRWNHDSVMRQGGIALASLLGARLIEVSSKFTIAAAQLQNEENAKGRV